MEVTVGLRIMSDHLDSERITRVLNISPTRTWKKGETIDTVRGQAPASSGGWFFYSTSTAENDLERTLQTLLTSLAPCSEAIHQLKKEGFWIDICCNISSDDVVGFILSPHLLAQLVGLELEIDFSIGPSDFKP
jgi:hypothetical protein